ncbi:unnamed protein product [Dovyalis caffra]|uniref:Uncharacterized protein n=1 Tax=Dovyalis caffra TaxID=77055 RepID=A0AAV1RS56_9ROSI|nr:unnamed protein product [Dovyalis caffra]
MEYFSPFYEVKKDERGVTTRYGDSLLLRHLFSTPTDSDIGKTNSAHYKFQFANLLVPQISSILAYQESMLDDSFVETAR